MLFLLDWHKLWQKIELYFEHVEWISFFCQKSKTLEYKCCTDLSHTLYFCEQNTHTHMHTRTHEHTRTHTHAYLSMWWNQGDIAKMRKGIKTNRKFVMDLLQNFTFRSIKPPDLKSYKFTTWNKLHNVSRLKQTFLIYKIKRVNLC